MKHLWIIFILLLMACATSAQKRAKQSEPTNSALSYSTTLPSTPTQGAPTRLHARDKFYKYSGKSAIYVIGAGYTYALPHTSSKDYGAHLVNLELFNYRLRLFGISPADFEMQVGSDGEHKKWGGWVGYRPSLKVYMPLAGAVALYFYGGAQIDGTEWLSKIFKNMSYTDDLPYYKALNAFGGVALQLTAMRHIPIELHAEYRHPIRNKTFMPAGLYFSGRIMVGDPHNRTPRIIK